MRPAKRILLACEDEERACILRFVLRHSVPSSNAVYYSVTFAINAAYALEAIKTARYDVLLCQKPLKGVDELVGQARASDVKMKIVVLTDRADQTPSAIVDAVLCRAPMMELLERLKVLVQKKRGPSPSNQKKCAGIVAREMARRAA